MLRGVFWVFLEIRIKPTTFIQTTRRDKRRADFPIIAWLEASNFLFTFEHNGQRGRLNTTDRRFKKSTILAVERGHRSRTVDAHQPVGLGTRTRGGL